MTEHEKQFEEGLISVIAGNYNTPVRFVKKAIDSILSQTYRNFELIIVDDCSTDDSFEAIKEYRDPRIRLLSTEKNSGLATALNLALDVCRGEYAARMDLDDVAEPERFEKQIAFMRANPDVILSGTWIRYIDENGVPSGEGSKAVCSDPESYRIHLLFANAPMIVHPTWMLNRRLLEKHGIRYKTQYKYSQDFAMLVSCARCGRCAVLQEILLNYRIHGSSASAMKKREQIAYDWQIIQEQLDELHLTIPDDLKPLHHRFLQKTRPFDRRLIKWTNEIMKANKQYRVFDQKKLRKIIYYRWVKNAFYRTTGITRQYKRKRTVHAEWEVLSLNNSELVSKNDVTQDEALSTLATYIKEAPFAIKATGVKKEYRIGQFSGRTLRMDFQSWMAKKRGREDPNVKLADMGRYVGKDRFMALNGVDLEIRHGETVGLIGANGAGKSTLLKLLSRVTGPTEGKIEIYGRIASLLEVGTGFNGEFTGRENIYMNGAILGMTKEEITRKMDAIIEFSEIGKHIDTPVKRYSSGMQVKLGFAVAVNLDAEIMIMDEVLAVGDMAFQKKCIDKMHGIEEEHGKTIIYVSHNMDTIKRLCERCIVLNQGKVIFDGPADEAIALYMGINGSFSHHYEYPESCHSKMRFRNAVIETLDFPESFTGQLAEGRRVGFTLSVRGKADIREAFIRLEVVNAYGTIAGIMISRQSFALKKDHPTTVQVEMDSTHLAPGNYRMNLAVFTFSELNDKLELDKVESAFTFETLYNDADKSEDRAHWFSDWRSNINLIPLEVSGE